MPRYRRALVALTIGCLPVIPATTYAGGGVGGGGVGGGGSAPINFAGGAQFQVDAPTPAGHNYGFMKFYPQAQVARVGDTVTWAFANNQAAVHTITLLPTNMSDKQMGATFNKYVDQNQSAWDVDDGNGHSPMSRYWAFNLFQARGCGNSAYFPGTAACNFNGKGFLNSGLMVTRDMSTGAPLPNLGHSTFQVRFTAPGTYRFFCLIHGPHMGGVVKVLPATAPAPSYSGVAALVQKQWSTDVAKAKAVENHVGYNAAKVSANGTTTYTVHAGLTVGQTEIDEFIPKNVHIAKGDTVKWATGGFHTVTFPAGTGAWIANPTCEAGKHDVATSWVLSSCGNNELELHLGLRALAPSGPPGADVNGGFYNSGPLGPPGWAAHFPYAGSFTYECLVHKGMVASVTSS